jgi:transcriptional regulator with XRE-family HTH domain
MATIRQYRYQLGISMSVLARKANIATSTVSRAEEGLPIQELKAVQIAKALSALLGREISVGDIDGLRVY